MKLAKTGAVLFVLWGVLHMLGGAAILAAAAGSPDAGYATYDPAASGYTALAGDVLAYLAWGFAWIGALVAWVAIRYNWRNSEAGLALNTVLVGLTDLGLLLFLVLPGHLGWAEASPGLALFAAAALAGGFACRAAGHPAHAV